MNGAGDFRPQLGDLRCGFCGESMDAQGNDPWELLLTSHYCDDLVELGA